MKRLYQVFSLLLGVLASLPALSQTPYSWLPKVSGGGHGNSLCSNPINPNIIYGSPNTSAVWISRDRGNTWVQLSTVGGSGGIAAIAVNPLDTNQIIVAQRSSPDRVMKTTNDGQTWTQTWAGGSFNSYGVPKARSMSPEYDRNYLATAIDFENYRTDSDLLVAAR